MKLSLGNLNPDTCPPHSTTTYICEMTTASFLVFDSCGGVKPGPMRWAQIQRFINNTSEERKS